DETPRAHALPRRPRRARKRRGARLSGRSWPRDPSFLKCPAQGAQAVEAPGPDRPLRDGQDRGNLSYRPPVVEQLDNHPPVDIAQRIEGRGDEQGVNHAVDSVVGCLRGSLIEWDLARSRSAVAVISRDGNVACDLMQPRTRMLARQLPCMLPRPQHRFLNHVLGGLYVAVDD